MDRYALSTTTDPYEIGDTYTSLHGETTVLWERRVADTEGDDYQLVAVEAEDGARWQFRHYAAEAVPA